ncbi:MAG: DUF916 domain-containing protein [Bifidobacteriaceae bacterium]|jgi:hypothetical protein|nr:DUF916 domain-containing protein [Bifidobacteriaceae bacterium]
MTTPVPRPTRFVALALTTATLLACLSATASAADTPEPTATPSGSTEPAAPASSADGDPSDDREVTWSVRPATEAGPDGRHVFDYQVGPGDTITDWMAVTNYSERPATFQVYATDATTDYDTAAFTLIGADQGPSDLGAWTAVDATTSACADDPALGAADCASPVGFEVALDPGETRQFPFTTAIPRDAAPGDHAAGLVASFQSEGVNNQGATVKMAQRVGARLYVRVDGPLTPAITMSGAVISYLGTWNPFGRGAARIGFDVTDIGNTRLSAEARIRLTGPFGIHLGDATLEPVNNLMPGGTAHVTADLPGIAPLFLLFGRFEVTPVGADGMVSTDELPGVLTADASVLAIPWTALALIALVVGGGIGTIALRRRFRRRWAEDMQALEDELRHENGDADDAEYPATRSAHHPAPTDRALAGTSSSAPEAYRGSSSVYGVEDVAR